MAEEPVQRRLAAILAADVVGYSAMMERAEEATFVDIGRLRREVIEPRLTRHHGRLIKTTGDGFLAEFASTIEAVRCAAAIQDELAANNDRLRLRIGINLGDVLVEHSGDVYGEGVNVAARLEALAEPGGILISGKVYSEVDGKLEISFEDRGERHLKNIAKPVRTYAVRNKADMQRRTSLTPTAHPLLPDKSSIAVLPFQNMSGDPEQEYFADGITEDIITALSKWRSFLVIARNSTFTYKGRSVDAKIVGRELGARYVLEGSVRKAGNRLRITAQLIEAATAAHIWAERYDREMADVFVIQDDLSTRIAAVIETELGRHEQKRSPAKPPANLEAWDCLNRGLYLIYKFTREDNAVARTFLERAVALDPELSRAHSSLAYTYQQDLLNGYADDRDKAIDQLTAHAQRAVQLDDQDSYAHVMLGFGYRWERRPELVVAEGRKAIECNPSDAWAFGLLGLGLDLIGQHDEAIESMKRAMAMNPRDPHTRFFAALIARAHLVDDDTSAAEEWARRAIEYDPRNPRPHLILAVALARLGRDAEARAALEAGEHLHPGFAKQWMLGREYRNEADNDLIIEGLRKAGLAD